MPDGGGGTNILQVAPDGSLLPAAPGTAVSHGDVGSLVDPDRQATPCPHSAFVDPSGRRVVVSDLGTDELITFDVDCKHLFPIANKNRPPLTRMSTFHSKSV